MLTLTSLILLSLTITAIFVSLTLILSEKPNKEREKMTPFECGFSPHKKARSSFSLQYFMTTLIFLIFDMEIIMVMPMGVLEKNSNFSIWSLTVILVLIILLGGLLYEWKNGALEWVK